MDWLDQIKASGKSCTVPFEFIKIGINGEVHVCMCEAWLPYEVGNILDFNSRDEFFESIYNHEVIQSFYDGSHKFCNFHTCQVMQNFLYQGQKNELFQDRSKLKNIKLKTLNLSIDDSCNLQCPSCRDKLIIRKSNWEYQERIKKILDKCDEFFFNPQIIKNIHALSAGEFLASNLLFNWMVEKSKLPGIRFNLQSNGTLIYKNKDKIESILNKTNFITVSIDAATKPTYNITRVNGNWEDLIKSLDYIKEFKINKKNLDFRFCINFVISKFNYKEILDFIDFGLHYNVDEIHFDRIIQWPHMSDETITELDVLDSNHPNFEEVMRLVKHEKFKHPVVWNNFNYLI